MESKMLGKKVVFTDNGGATVEGRIMDKINVLMASGVNEYVPMDNYVVLDDASLVHVINPINVKEVVKSNRAIPTRN